MRFVSLDQVKSHLRIIGDDENDLLDLYRNAAERSAERFIGRAVFDNNDVLQAAVDAGTAGEQPMVADDDVRAAVLLTVGYLYRNREDAMTPVGTAMTSGARWLLLPYRIDMGV